MSEAGCVRLPRHITLSSLNSVGYLEFPDRVVQFRTCATSSLLGLGSGLANQAIQKVRAKLKMSEKIQSQRQPSLYSRSLQLHHSLIPQCYLWKFWLTYLSFEALKRPQGHQQTVSMEVSLCQSLPHELTGRRRDDENVEDTTIKTVDKNPARRLPPNMIYWQGANSSGRTSPPLVVNTALWAVIDLDLFEKREAVS